MQIAPQNIVAFQITRPMNPMSHARMRNDVVVDGSRPVLPPVSGSLQDAILAASQVAGRVHQSYGVFQVRDGAYTLSPLAVQESTGATTPLRFEGSASGPIGGAVTVGFDVTRDGSGLADGPALRAIVGEHAFASFANGTSGAITSLEG